MLPGYLGILKRHSAVWPRTTTERNILCLYMEVAFAAVLAAASSFDSAYVLRLGGSSRLVGLLASLPALVAIVTYLPSARVLQRKARYSPWVVGSLLLARSGYVLILLLPLLLKQLLPEVTVGVLVAMTAPAVFFSTGWSPLMSDVIPERSRATVLAWRSILSSATVASLTFFVGSLLDRGVFPRNYQWLYAIGFLGGALSVLFVAFIRVPEESAPTLPAAGSRAEGPHASFGVMLRENKGFARLILNTLLFNLGAWMLGPLYIIFFVRELGATDSWVGLHTTLAHVGVVVGYWLWRKIARRLGDAKTLLLALPLTVTYPFMVAALPRLTPILFAGFLINTFAPGVNLSHSLIFLELLPRGRKHDATALYSMMMNVGAFACPLLGVALAGQIGILPTLLIGGVLRVAGAALFYVFPVKGERPRFSWVALAGLLRRRR
jgi:Na+/melibiose symporter-like transporter